MTTINDITELSQKYLKAHNETYSRIRNWDEKKEFIKGILEEIHSDITEKNDYFKSNLYVNHNEHSVLLKSGNVNVPSSQSEPERGFEIVFQKISNGGILVFVNHHSTSNNIKNEQLELILNYDELTREKVIDLVYKGIEKAMKTSFLFIGSE